MIIRPFMSSRNIRDISLSSHQIEISFNAKLADLFPAEWQELVRMIIILPKPLESARRWISKKYTSLCVKDLSEVYCCQKLAESCPDIEPFHAPCWDELLLDLQEKVPIIVGSDLIYQSKIFLLPGRVQADLLTVIYLHFDKIGEPCLLTFTSFLLKNVEKLNDWGRTLIPKYLSKRNCMVRDVTKPCNRNECCTTADLKLNIGTKRSFDNIVEAYSKEYKYIPIKYEPCPIHICMREEKKMPYSSISLSTAKDELIEANIPNSDKESDSAQNFQHQACFSITQSEQTCKKQKLDSENDSKIVTTLVKQCNLHTVSKDAMSYLEETPQISDIMELRENITECTHHDAACKILNSFKTIPARYIEEICDIICLRTLDEKQICFFVDCCLSDKVFLNVSLIEILLNQSLTTFLLKLNTTLTRNMYSCLLDKLRASKELLTSTVILTILLSQEINIYQEEVVLKLLSSEDIQHGDLAEILSLYLAKTLHSNVAVSNSALKFIEFVMEKKTPSNSVLVSDLVELFEKNSKLVRDSNIFLKIVITLSKLYKNEMLSNRQRLISIIEKSTSFLKKSARVNLQKI